MAAIFFVISSRGNEHRATRRVARPPITMEPRLSEYCSCVALDNQSGSLKQKRLHMTRYCADLFRHEDGACVTEDKIAASTSGSGCTEVEGQHPASALQCWL